MVKLILETDHKRSWSYDHQVVRTDCQWAECCTAIQQAIDALVRWSTDWQLSISVNKCCVL